VFSIVTPSLNQGHFIGDAIRSVLRQVEPAVEHLIVDGRSSDDTAAVVADYARRYPTRLHWLSEPDAGQADAVNKGLALARGDIVGWLNADDAYLLPTTLREVRAAFRRFPQADLVYGDGVLMSADYRVLKVLCMPAFSQARLRRRNCLLQPAVFWRRHVSQRERLDPTLLLAADYEYWLRLAQRYEFRHVRRPWAADRHYAARRSHALRAQMQAEDRSLQARYPTPRLGAWRRVAETALVKWPDLARGLLWLPRFYAARHRLTLPLRFGRPARTVRDQLFARVEELAETAA
jgi:glycosyltransferase involved in cell wall biosynthesis